MVNYNFTYEIIIKVTNTNKIDLNDVKKKMFALFYKSPEPYLKLFKMSEDEKELTITIPSGAVMVMNTGGDPETKITMLSNKILEATPGAQLECKFTMNCKKESPYV